MSEPFGSLALTLRSGMTNTNGYANPRIVL
jgi:hypothetical protein